MAAHTAFAMPTAGELVNGDPLANIDLIGDPATNFAVIMKDGKIAKGA